MAERGPVFLVIGAGAGIGGHSALRFSREGHHAVLVRRSDGEGLERLASQIRAQGGSASTHLADITQPGSIERIVEETESAIGPIACALYNLGAQIGHRPLDETGEDAFELGWQLGCLGLFRLARSLLPRMADRAAGCLLVTSATAAMRGNAGQHSHAAAMGARRLLCQSLNDEFAGKGIHIVHLVIDGAVDAPDTLGRMLGDQWEQFRKSRGEHGLVDPRSVADTYWHLANQPRDCWTHELDIRPWTARAWWNG